jgi:SAM-dependent methyltransferase
MAVRQTTAGRISQMLKTWTSGESGQVSGQGSHDIDKYNKLHDDSVTSVEGRNAAYVDLVNSYYNLATDFYEWGWGQSFHFAEKHAGESFNQSIARHEYYLAARCGVQPTDHVLDCGCGIGGPLRNIVRFTGARVTGVTLNQYQVDRGNSLCASVGLDDKCRLVQADFHKLPFEAGTFEHCYSIEACCHSPDRADVYGEIFRVLKPGAPRDAPPQAATRPRMHAAASPPHAAARQSHPSTRYGARSDSRRGGRRLLHLVRVVPHAEARPQGRGAPFARARPPRRRVRRAMAASAHRAPQPRFAPRAVASAEPTAASRRWACVHRTTCGRRRRWRRATGCPTSPTRTRATPPSRRSASRLSRRATPRSTLTRAVRSGTRSSRRRTSTSSACSSRH